MYICLYKHECVCVCSYPFIGPTDVTHKVHTAAKSSHSLCWSVGCSLENKVSLETQMLPLQSIHLFSHGLREIEWWCPPCGYHSPLSKAYWLKWRAHLNPSSGSSSKPGQDETRHCPPWPMSPSPQAECIQELVTGFQVLPFCRVVCLSMGMPVSSIGLPVKEPAHAPSSSHNVKMFPWIKWPSKDSLARCSEVSISFQGLEAKAKGF